MCRSRSITVTLMLSLLVCIALGLAGCAKPTLGTIDIEPSSSTVTVGQTQQLRATGSDTKGRVMEDLTFSWSADGESGRIDANGLFTALRPGQVTITAAVEGVQGTVTITVKPEDVASIATTTAPTEVVAGEQAQLIVTAQNAAGQGVAFVQVELAVSEGTTVDKTSATTDAAGQATFTITTLPQAQAHSVQVSAGGQQTTVVVQGQPGAPASFDVTVEPGEVVVGQEAQIQVTVQDQNANAIAGAQVQFAPTSEGTSVTPQEATTDAQGQASVVVQTRLNAGVNQVQIRVAELDVQEVQVQGQPGPPANVDVTVEPGEVVVGQEAQIQVTVQDQNGNAITGAQVQFTPASEGTSVTPQEATSDAQGQASAVLQARTNAGVNRVQIRVAELDAQEVQVEGQPGPPATLRATVEPLEVIAGDEAEIEVAVQDQAGNPVPNAAVQFEALSEGTSLTPGDTTTDARGLARSQVRTSPIAGANLVQIRAADIEPQDVQIVGLAGAPATFRIQAERRDLIVGDEAEIEVRVQDQAGNPVPDAPVRFEALSEGTRLTLDETTTDVSGLVRSQVRMSLKAGDNRVQVRVADLVPQTVQLQGRAGAATTSRLEAETRQVIAGDEAEIAVIVQDQAGNPVPETPVRFLALSEGTTLTFAETVTDAQGRAKSRVLTSPRAGNNLVQVRVADLASHQVQIEGRTGSPSLLMMRTAATATVASAGVPIMVQVSDRHGNPVPGVAVNFAVTPQSGAAVARETVTSDASGMARTVLQTSQEPGDNTVHATVAQLQAMSLSIEGNPPTAVRVMPPTSTIDMLDSLQFRAIAADANGNTVDISPVWKVPGNNGTVDAQGRFTATGLGEELAIATYAGLTGGGQITVVPGDVASVEVMPTEASVTAGTNHQFQAAVFNAHRYPLDVSPSWKVTNDLGTIDSSGLLTAIKVGQATIVATAGRHSGRADITITPGALATVKVEPHELRMQAGEDVQLQAQGFDAVGNAVSIEPVWSLNANLGELDSTGVFRARHVGTGHIQVAAGPLPIVVTIPVQVAAAELDRVEVEPNTLTLSAGEEQTFTATGYDAYRNTIEVTPIWRLTKDIGNLDDAGVFQARRAGSAQVQAVVGDLTGQASVTVKPSELARLTVQPAGPLTLTAGVTVSLSITGYDAYNNTVAVTPTWSQTAPLGTLSSKGFFRAEKIGTGRLVARSGAHSISVQMTVLIGKLARVAITPTATTMQAGNVSTFHATGFDAYDNDVPISPAWRVTESIGAITAAGEFTAIQAHPGEVIATAEGISGSAEVTVEPGALTLLNVTPERLHLTAGETADILVVGYDAYGNPMPTQPVWHIPDALGTITDNTLTAQKAGRGRMVVAVEHLAAVVDVQVAPGTVASIEITPPVVQVASGERQKFTVHGFDRGGNRVPVYVTWDVNGKVGTINTQGVFTAALAGASRVQASAGPLEAQAEVIVVPGAAVRVDVTPETATLAAGETLTLRSAAFDAAGNQITTPPAWTVEGSIGKVSSVGIFMAQGAGSGQLIATIDEVSQAIEVQVKPGSMVTIAVSPGQLVLDAGASEPFHATGYDAYGNPLVVEPTWSVQGGIGQIDAAQGVFKAISAGSGSVIAVVGTIAGLATVSVEPGDVARLQIEPRRATVAAGESLPFTVTPFDAFQNETTADVSWDMATSLGQVNQGIFVGERVGTTEVVVSSGEAQARATVKVQQGPITHLQIIPRAVEVAAGEAVPLRVLGLDRYENYSETDVTWDPIGDIGTLTHGGVFTAGKQGQGQITAHRNGVSESIPVTVVPGPVQRLVLSPGQAQVASTRTQNFAVMGYDAGGNERRVQVRWALAGDIGHLSNTGQLEATHTGKGTVVAYIPSAVATSEIAVRPGPVALLFVTPQPIAASAGRHVEFRAQAFDAYKNHIPFLQLRWSVAGNIGSIDPDTGIFTGTLVGQGKIQAEADGMLGSADVVINPGVPDADKSQLVASRLIVPADGKTRADIIVRVQDRYGNPVINAQVTLISNRGDHIDQPIPTNQFGVAMGHIRSTNPGRSEIRAVIESVRISNSLSLIFEGPAAAG